MPKDVFFIIDTLNKNSYEAFVVGGAVRDSIMGNPCLDIDIATSATPMEVKALFSKTIDTGIKHGTVTVVKDRQNYEVTTYRIDGEYDDCRRPREVLFTQELEEDLRRRDFTVNAIAYHKSVGYADPFEGIQDIKRKLIRGVGDPDTRFKEDALRLLRCIRFAVRLGFDIEQTTYEALIANAHLIANISVERIRDELVKIFMTNNLESADKAFKDSKIISYVDTGLYEYLQHNFEKNLPPMKNTNADMVTRFVILLKDMDVEAAGRIMLSLKFSTNEIKEVTTLLNHVYSHFDVDVYSIKKLLSSLGADRFFKLVAIKAALGSDVVTISSIAKEIIEAKEPLTLRDLQINGNILKENNICIPQKMGQVLNYLLDQVLKDKSINNETELLELAKMYVVKGGMS